MSESTRRSRATRQDEGDDTTEVPAVPVAVSPQDLRVPKEVVDAQGDHIIEVTATAEDADKLPLRVVLEADRSAAPAVRLRVVGFKKYRRVGQAVEMADWEPDLEMGGVVVRAADAANGSPKDGDKIARDPKNHADKWLVSKEEFEEEFEAR